VSVASVAPALLHSEDSLRRALPTPLTAACEEAAAVRERNNMSKEASRIRRVISRLSSREDLAELVKMARSEVVCGLAARDLPRYDRGVAIYKAASEALGNARTRGQLPRYTQAA
jgi:hypothetical protein